MKRKVFLINLLILGVLFGFSQKARGDTIPTVFNVAVTQTGATAPLVREGSFDVEIIFTVDATNNLDLSVVPTVTFTPQVGGPFNITPLDPTNPLNFGPHPTPPADPAHNYYIFRGTGHALSTMGTGWANMTISGAQSDSGTMTSHTKTNAFYIDYTAPAVTPNCPAGITVAPPVTGVGTVVITVAFAENYLLDYSVLPTVAVSDASGAPVVVANPSYGGNTWTGTATIAGTVASGNATIVVTGATDLAGNVMLTCDQKTFLVDNTPPESSAQPLPACSNGVPILIFYQAQDVGSDSSGVASVQLWYRLNGGAWVNSGIASSGVVFAFSPALDGNYEFATVATDNVGNQEATPTITTTADASTILDQSAPTVASVTTIPDPAGEGNVTITITFADDGCGLDYDTIPTVSISPAVTVTRLTYENNTWTGQASIISTTTEGQATITIGGATDCCGNVMASNNNYSFCIDRTAPRIANTTDVQINPQNRGAGECSNIGEVTFTITFTENGCAGLDPDVDLDVFFNPAGTDEEIPVEGSYSSGNTWGGTAIVTEDMANGDATVIIRGATDRAGNAMAPYNQASFCIDTTAPSSQAEALNACFKGNPLRIYYQVNDLTSAIDFVELWYRQAGSLDWMFSGKSDATPLTGYFDLVVGSFPDGTYEFHTIAVDEVGNREAPPATADATTTLDRSRPTVASVTTTPDPAGEGNVTITITFNDEGCGLDYDTIPQVSYQIGVGPSVTVTQLTYEDNTWTGQALITGTAPTTEGQAVITIAGATDCCGNVMANNSAYGFCIDRTAPTIANTTDVQINPQNRGVGECSNIGEVTFTITFTENGCAGLDPDVDLDVLFNPAGTDEEIPVEGSYGSGNTWAGTAIVTEDMANGDATVIIRGATDRAGNAMAPYNQASFCIDTTAPQSWVEALSTHSNQSSITVKYQDNDPGVGNSGVNTVQLWYRLNGGTWIK
ncbi:hypothetical protein KJ693_12155, partial [bacterium]|nr:hypothetical protein [bacterium]MBU1616046.1 hypothetical protein [bacterium]